MSDLEIGKRLIDARGDMSQRDLAVLMRERGLRWSHVTVGSVERGERPLRLSEAAVVADVLACTPDSLAGMPTDSSYRLEATRLRAMTNSALEALTNH